MGPNELHSWLNNNPFDKPFEDPAPHIRKLTELSKNYFQTMEETALPSVDYETIYSQVSAAHTHCMRQKSILLLYQQIAQLRASRKILLINIPNITYEEGDETLRLQDLERLEASVKAYYYMRIRLKYKTANLRLRMLEILKLAQGGRRDDIVLLDGYRGMALKEVWKRQMLRVLATCPYGRAIRELRRRGFFVKPVARMFISDLIGIIRVMMKATMEVYILVDGVTEITEILVRGLWVPMFTPPAAVVAKSPKPEQFALPWDESFLPVSHELRKEYLRSRAKLGRVWIGNGRRTFLGPVPRMVE